MGVASALLSLLACAAVACATLGLAGLLGPRLSASFARRAAEDQRALDELFVRSVRAGQVLLASLALALGLAGLLGFGLGQWGLALLAGSAAVALPRVGLAVLRGKRRQRFEERLPDSITLLANATRAGLGLLQGLEEVAQRAPAPVSQEVGLIVRDVKLGGDLARSLREAGQRLRSRGFDLFSTALLVNREKGGNLPAALDTMAASLKEIWRLEQKLETSSAEGRKAVWLISGMPLFVFVLISAVDPSIPQTLFRSFAGACLVSVAAAVYGLGMWWMLRVLRRDV